MNVFSLMAFVALAVCAGVQTAEKNTGNYELARSLAARTEGKVFRDTVSPHWLTNNTQFWYRIFVAPGVEEFVLVDAATGIVRREKSAAAIGVAETSQLSTSRQKSITSKRTQTTGAETLIRMTNSTDATVEVYWVDTEGARKSYGGIRAGMSKEFRTYVGHVWLVTDSVGRSLGFFEATESTLEVAIDGRPANTRTQRSRNERRTSAESPDKTFSIQFTNWNALLIATNGETISLTTNGTAERPYRGPVAWSADSRHCVIQSIIEAPRRVVTIVDSSPRDQVQPKLLTYDYYKPGDVIPQPRPVLIDAATRTATTIPDDLFTNAFTHGGSLDIRWSPRGDEFYFDHNQRGHQLYRVLAVNATNVAVRTVVEERSNTFIHYGTKTWREWLDDTGELLWMSERDGWAHLWLYDATTGAVKNQVTRGEWVVRQVLKVDAAKRQVWFLAGGVRPGEDPYHRHLCRVNFDGSGFVRLTEGDGNHQVEFSPGGEWFMDRYSRADLPPVTELRRSDDGKLICELERADISRLLKAGWTMPERFVAKGRDGKTDIHGVIIKPSNFNPRKKYPVLEEVYAGPHDSFAPKTFGRLMRHHSLAELGFIVVQADGMGTDNRGKAFHDVCWKNLQDAGFPDRIAWIRAAAKTRPWMDLSRVGIYGGSAGGQSAMRAVLDHHHFYKVAFADCGCHDNRMDKIWWNEQWLGWPVDDSYKRASNVEDATRLNGKLMLMVGELDRNVDPASTTQVVNALQKAGKDFEHIVITGADHGAAETPYGSRRRMEFFVRHLIEAGREK